MPNITLIREHLFEAIGRQYTDEQFDELCFEFGVEVDDVETQVIEVFTQNENCDYNLHLSSKSFIYTNFYFIYLRPHFDLSSLPMAPKASM